MHALELEGADNLIHEIGPDIDSYNPRWTKIIIQQQPGRCNGRKRRTVELPLLAQPGNRHPPAPSERFLVPLLFCRIDRFIDGGPFTDPVAVHIAFRAVEDQTLNSGKNRRICHKQLGELLLGFKLLVAPLITRDIGLVQDLEDLRCKIRKGAEAVHILHLPLDRLVQLSDYDTQILVHPRFQCVHGFQVGHHPDHNGRDNT
ncbi:hypothetical protein D3C73_1117500 [compost metagenome]